MLSIYVWTTGIRIEGIVCSVRPHWVFSPFFSIPQCGSAVSHLALITIECVILFFVGMYMYTYMYTESYVTHFDWIKKSPTVRMCFWPNVGACSCACSCVCVCVCVCVCMHGMSEVR